MMEGIKRFAGDIFRTSAKLGKRLPYVGYGLEALGFAVDAADIAAAKPEDRPKMIRDLAGEAVAEGIAATGLRNPFTALGSLAYYDAKYNALADGTLEGRGAKEADRIYKELEAKRKAEIMSQNQTGAPSMRPPNESELNKLLDQELIEQQSESTLENLPLDKPRVDDVLLSNPPTPEESTVITETSRSAESPGDRASNIAKNELALKYERDMMMGKENIGKIKKSLGYAEGSNLAKWAEANPALAQRLYEKQF